MTRRYRKFVDNPLNDKEYAQRRALALRINKVRRKPLGQAVRELLAVKPKPTPDKDE